MPEHQRVGELPHDVHIFVARHDGETACAAEGLRQRAGEHDIVRERAAERFERVTRAERTVDRNPVGVVDIQVTTERLEGGQHRSHVDQAAHRADAVDQHDRRPTGGRDLADCFGQCRGVGHVEAPRRPDLLEHTADHLDGGVRCLFDEERDAGVGHGIAGQRARAEQRQQAEVDVAD